MSAVWLLLRSYRAFAYVACAAILTLVGLLLGPGPRSVMVRDGAIGEPLVFIIALVGSASMACLGPPRELDSVVPMPRKQTAGLRAAFVFLITIASSIASAPLAPGLAPATLRNAMMALALTFIASIWHPQIAWLPSTTYLILSWFYGTPVVGDTPRAWALPAHPPSWGSALTWILVALAAAICWSWIAGTRPRSSTRRPA